MTSKKLSHKIKSDPVYSSTDIAKLINLIMVSGKKSIASKIVYTAITAVEKQIIDKYGDVAKGMREIFIEASPNAKVSVRRIGRSVVKIPVILNENEKILKGANAIAECVRKSGNKAHKNLERELNAILQGTGSETAKQKLKIEEEINANKALASAYIKNF